MNNIIENINSYEKIINDVKNCICYSINNQDCYHYDTKKYNYKENYIENYLYNRNPNYFYMSDLSHNSKLTLNIIKKYINNSGIEFEWKTVTENIGSIEIALSNPEIPFCWRTINKKLTSDMIKKNYFSKWCWLSLTKHKNIHNAVIKECGFNVEEKNQKLKLYRNFGLSEPYIREHSNTDKEISELFKYFLNIDRDIILRNINRILYSDNRLNRDIISIIYSYF